MNHTPGPWKVSERLFIAGGSKLRIHRRVVREHGVERPIANVNGDPGPKEETDANARLIAAAPDLADALKALIAEVESFQEDEGFDVAEGEIAAARAALAKAGVV